MCLLARRIYVEFLESFSSFVAVFLEGVRKCQDSMVKEGLVCGGKNQHDDAQFVCPVWSWNLHFQVFALNIEHLDYAALSIRRWDNWNAALF